MSGFFMGCVHEAAVARAKAGNDSWENKKDEPPKPPRRPNIPIGRMALRGV